MKNIWDQSLSKCLKMYQIYESQGKELYKIQYLIMQYDYVGTAITNL